VIIELALTTMVWFFQPQSASHPPIDDWPLAMTSSKIAWESPFVQRLSEAIERPVATLAVANPQPSSTTAPPQQGKLRPAGGAPPLGLTENRMSPEQIARIDAFTARIWAQRDEADDLIAQGRLVEARSKLESFLFRVPSEVIGAQLMDVEFIQGDYVSAYKVAVPLVRAGRVSPRLLIRASLAAATLGEVYRGQREFLISQIQGRDPNNEYAKGLSLGGDSPQVVAALSHILIGSELDSQGKHSQALPHWEAAIKVDPENSVLCRALATSYSATYRYSLAIQTAQSGLDHADKTSDIYETLKIDLRRYRSQLRTLGDGRTDIVAVPKKRTSDPPGTIHP
jgi:tetratricopeptide (TPR) repeat protein